MKKTNSLPILIVEDNDDDYELAICALKRKHSIQNEIIRAKNGDEAISFLKKDGGNKPGIILLDLNLPGITGQKVIELIRSDPAIKGIPIIVLTSSKNEKDVRLCYEKGANTYIVKPIGFAKFLEATSRLKEFWIETAILPFECEPPE